MKLRNIRFADIGDCFYPRLYGDKAPQNMSAFQTQTNLEEQVATLHSDEARLKESLASIGQLVEQEQLRRGSVDTRLMSIIGLTSVAATIVLTALFAMAFGTMPLPQGAAKWALVLGCFYLAIQLHAALSAAVNGLSRASYTAETAFDLLPSKQLAIAVFFRHRILSKIKLLEQHQDVNNNKVSQMAVAHRAMFNFLYGLLFLAVIAGVLAISRDPSKEADKLESIAQAIDNLSDKLEIQSIHHQAHPPRKIELIKVVTVGPFPEGGHELNQEVVFSCVREAVKIYADYRFVAWQIVGRFDKRPLRASNAGLYSSNQFLAMARAVWVNDQVLSRIEPFNQANAVLLVGGSRHATEQNSDLTISTDRVVDVYGLVDIEAQSANSAKPSKELSAITCH